MAKPLNKLYTMQVTRQAPIMVPHPPFVGSSRGKPCMAKSVATGARCPVQLVFKQSVPHLRFCTAHKKPGLLVPAPTPQDALRIARAACGCWARHGKKFEGCVPTRQVGQIGHAELTARQALTMAEIAIKNRDCARARQLFNEAERAPDFERRWIDPARYASVRRRLGWCKR